MIPSFGGCGATVRVGGTVGKEVAVECGATDGAAVVDEYATSEGAFGTTPVAVAVGASVSGYSEQLARIPTMRLTKSMPASLRHIPGPIVGRSKVTRDTMN